MAPTGAVRAGMAPSPHMAGLPSAARTRRSGLDPLLWALTVLLVLAGAGLALALVAELAAPMASGPHHDFLAFYAAGKLVLDGRPGGLYDPSAITAIQRTVIPVPVGANGYMPFINPPFAAVAFAPLALLPAAASRVAWALLSVAMLVAAAAWMARPLPPRERIATVLLVVLSFPAYHSLAEGQWSAAMLLGGLAALVAARRGSWTLAGVALATWWLKPQLAVLPLVALALDRRWTAVVSTVATGAVLAIASLPFVGIGAYVTYVGYVVQVGLSHFNGAGAIAPSVWQGNLTTAEGLNGFLVGVLGQGSVVGVDAAWGALSVGLVLLWLIAASRTRPGFATLQGRRMVAAGIGIVLLVNPNLFVQDCLLVFLLLPALWPLPGASYWRAAVGVAVLAAITLVDQPLASHLFTVALFALVVGICAAAIAPRATAAPSTPPAFAPR